jgi:hypothetical protein
VWRFNQFAACHRGDGNTFIEGVVQRVMEQPGAQTISSN